MSAVVLAIVLSALLKYASGRGNPVQCLNGCYCDASSWLVLKSTVQYEDRTENVTKWPKGCYCHFTFALSQLSIDCGQSIPPVSEQQLSRHLGSFLRADFIAKHVTSLSITNTTLQHIPASVCQLLNLTTLSLEHNRITSLPDNCFTKLTKIVTLSLAFNTIFNLQDGLFDRLQSLKTLRLSSNQISRIGLRVFSNVSTLTGLRSLDLNANMLTSLEPWWYYRCILGNKSSPVHIYLNYNRISKFTNELLFDFRCGLRRPIGYIDLSANPITHIMDILKGWNITEFGKLLCLSNYGVHLHPLMHFNVQGFHYVCDCVDYPIYKTVTASTRSTLLKGIYCNNFLNIIGQRTQVSAIPLIQFVCEKSDHCPSSCRCVYRPGNTTLHVYCSSANISSFPLRLPSLPKSYVRYKLDFSNNKLLRRLGHHPYFVNTSILDVSYCRLTEINIELLKDVSRLNVVNLRGNMLQSFPRAASTVNMSATLLLGLNPWKCSCDNSWMIEWLQSLSHQISDPGDIICRSPARMYGRNVIKSTSSDFCVYPVQRTLTITLSLACAVFAVIVMLVIVVILMYKLKEKCYKRWKFHPFDRDECGGEDMTYDVFFCCSSEDDLPHGRPIIYQIQSKGYRVCYHKRDFLPGQLITVNMGRAIERSKRTVCLVSRNFLERYSSTVICIGLLELCNNSSSRNMKQVFQLIPCRPM